MYDCISWINRNYKKSGRSTFEKVFGFWPGILYYNFRKSGKNAPSLQLWNQLSSLYNVGTLVCAMMVCVGVQGKKNRLLRVGIYLFTIMEWVSAVGFGMFPLSDSGYAGTFQDKMHIFSTVIVVFQK